MVTRFVEGPVSDFVKNCVDIPQFLECCRECPYFNKRWSCPPFDFSVEHVWDLYKTIILYEVKVLVPLKIAQIALDNEDINAFSSDFIKPAKMLMTDDLLALEEKYYGSKALIAGTCDICSICSKEHGDVCRYPEKMRYSIESLGGDVVRAVRIYFDDSIQWARDGHLPDYFILLGGLLIP